MATIYDYLGKIASAIYGKDVRQSIIDAIKQCYLDGKAGAIDMQARQDLLQLAQTIVESEKYQLSDEDKQEIAEMVESITFHERPKIVSDVSEMVDTSKWYVLETTNTVWEYRATKGMKEVVEKIVGTTDNPFESGRLGSTGTASSQTGYVITPHIDLIKYNDEFELHLEGIQFSNELSGDSYNTYAQYDKDKTFISNSRNLTNSSAFNTFWSGAEFVDNGDGTAKILFTPPVTNKSVEVGYVRFTGKGTEAEANVYVKYETEVVGYAWVDTGIIYGDSYASEEIAEIKKFNLANASVKSFMNMKDYSNDDYSYTNVIDHAGSDYYRKDLPVPIVLNWEKDKNVVEYTVSINTLGGVLNTGMQMYYTKDNKFVIYNLIPSTIYFYKIHGIYSDSTIKLLKNGSFETSADVTRMLKIDGIQNVRDIGGYTGIDNKKVKYALLYRGSAMDEAVASTFKITDEGKQEMLSRVGIKTDLDLRYNISESILGSGVDFKSVPYGNYATVITDTTQKGYFKTIFEYIVTQLTNKKPIYIHCQGGCDRTGTLVFLLLGLLGVSESDLAKEYELSSFSNIGKKSRIRNSTVYDYSGMVVALKNYTGNTITDKFVSFATECGITSERITEFRNLMLE